MLMSLGLFVFEARTSAAISGWQRTDNERWASNPRMGKRANWQHLGPGDDKVTLSCTLYPEFTGGVITLDVLRAMKRSAKSWLLFAGAGRLLGQYFIESIDESHHYFTRLGHSKKIEFSLKLVRTDNNRIEKLGNLSNQVIKLTLEQ